MKLACSTRIALLLGLALGTCLGCVSGSPRVLQYGGMREVLHEGRSEPRVAIAEVQRRPRAHAVGALAGLAGEITIVDGVAWRARVVDGQPVIAGAQGEDQAALLTLAYVGRWRTTRVVQPLADGALEAAIKRAAQEAGMATDAPLPFRIDGEFTALTLHIVRGACPMGGGAADQAPGDLAPWRWRLDRPARGQLVGFFARGREGVVTHHGTSVHAHAIIEHQGRTLMGHVEAASLAGGALLSVPR
ncbi:MAG: acetolactate decarboxylase [Planctomycetes bacterium]|nr:acetolactate decarboxylase [Planctomycetota bacterium]